MQRQNIKRNLFYQYLYQALILVIPFILSPYLTRTLQDVALGTYTYANSVSSYFVMIAMLGLSRYGQRIIAQSKDDATKLRVTFWSLFAVHVCISLLATFLHFIFVAVFIQEQKCIYFIHTFYVLSALFDVTWLFLGLENFKNIVIKNACVRIVEFVMIFSFVHAPSDLWRYTLITNISYFAGQAIMVPQAVKVIKPIRFTTKDVTQHIKPLLVFSVSVMAISLYTVFDKTLLGLMSTKENVAFYEYSNKIISIPKTIVGVTGTVMFPRACSLVAQGKIQEQRKYINYSFIITGIVGMGSMFGLLAIADIFSITYYGNDFIMCGKVIKALSPLVVIIGVGDIIRTQYMIPNKMDKQYNMCIILNAIVNIVLSIILIPTLGIFGAVIGTVSAEVFGLLYQMILCKGFIRISDVLKDIVPFLLCGFIMYIAVSIIDIRIQYGFSGLILEVIVGVFVYGLSCALYFVLFKRQVWRGMIRKILSGQKHR